MTTEKISLDALTAEIQKHIAARIEGGFKSVKISFDGPKMNRLSFGQGYYEVNAEDVPQVIQAVVNAGGMPWDIDNEEVFTI